MSVVCQCPSCKAKYQVGEQYAGHSIKCPKCAAAVVVPAVAQPTSPTVVGSPISSSGGAAKAAPAAIASKVELPKARAVGLVKDPPAEASAKISSSKISRAVALSPANDASDDQDSEPPPAGDDLGFLNDVGPVTTSHAAPKGSSAHRQAGPKGHPTPAEPEEASGDAPSGDAAIDLASISSLAARSSKAAHLPHLKKKKQGFPPWLMATITGVGVAVVAGIWLIVHLTSTPKPTAGPTAGGTVAGDAKNSSKAASAPKGPVLTIDWPESQRAGASLTVNGVKREIPLTGAIEIPLAPSRDQYHFRFQRPGFKSQEFSRVFMEDDKKSVSDWEPLEPRGLNWEQDYDAAKQKASSEHKNVLILFDASDDKGSSFASGRFKDAVFKRKEFREQADKEYVCVYIDNPKNAEGQDEVKDADRNAKVTEKFGIKVFPTVVVTDAKGRPFGVLEGYKISGINAFVPLMEKWAADSKQFFGLLAKFDAMLKKKDSPNAELAGEVLDFLELSQLDRFYAHTIKKAMACLPKGEGRPVTKESADMWMRRLAMASRNSDEAKKVVDQFDRWKRTRTFKDKEMGAALHLVAAGILARLDLRKEAAQKCKEGLALQPHNPMVRAYLEQFSRILAVEPGQPVLMPVGSGTGYCVAEGNYLLTNHHVIRGAKEIKVRLNGETEMYTAKLIADNESGDMAILKIELPGGRKLAPIPLMANELKIGERVCALGWPGVMSQNITLTFTQGVVSTLPPPDDDEAFIVTDCTVNPGNSGGPLCSVRGGVAGMVTRKSQITSHESSYGMAIPVGRLRKFLSEKLPKTAHLPPAAGATSANMELSDVAEKVKPSVVYIENIQEIHAPGPGVEQDQESEPGE